jgi:hypothetical protein
MCRKHQHTERKPGSWSEMLVAEPRLARFLRHDPCAAWPAGRARVRILARGECRRLCRHKFLLCFRFLPDLLLPGSCKLSVPIRALRDTASACMEGTASFAGLAGGTMSVRLRMGAITGPRSFRWPCGAEIARPTAGCVLKRHAGRDGDAPLQAAHVRATSQRMPASRAVADTSIRTPSCRALACVRRGASREPMAEYCGKAKRLVRWARAASGGLPAALLGDICCHRAFEWVSSPSGVVAEAPGGVHLGKIGDHVLATTSSAAPIRDNHSL